MLGHLMRRLIVPAALMLALGGCGDPPTEMSDDEFQKAGEACVAQDLYLNIEGGGCVSAAESARMLIKHGLIECAEGEEPSSITGDCPTQVAVADPEPTPAIERSSAPPVSSEQEARLQAGTLMEMMDRQQRAYKGCDSGMMDACDEAERLRKKFQDKTEKGTPLTKDW